MLNFMRLIFCCSFSLIASSGFANVKHDVLNDGSTSSKNNTDKPLNNFQVYDDLLLNQDSPILLAKRRSKRKKSRKKSNKSTGILAYAPLGLGHFSTGNSTKGMIFAGSQLVFFGMGIYYFMDANTLTDELNVYIDVRNAEYSDLPADQQPDHSAETIAKRDADEEVIYNQYIMGNVMIGLGLASWGWSVYDALSGSKSKKRRRRAAIDNQSNKPKFTWKFSPVMAKNKFSSFDPSVLLDLKYRF